MKKPNLNRLEYFVAIVEAGTITGAADRMRISKAVVSKQLRLLEEELGETLVIRNSRHMKVTETGQSFYEAARASVAQAEEAYAMISQGRTEPSGSLSITAPLDLGVSYVAPVVADFRAAYPQVTVHLTLSDARLDPVEARFDIAYRVGWLTDSSNVASKLAEFEQIVVAAPELIKQFGNLENPGDLTALPFIEHRALSNPCRWNFSQSSDEPVQVEMTPALSADVTPAIKALILQGAGISVLPEFFVRQELANGSLVRLIPDWSLRAGGIYSVYPPTQFRSSATKIFANIFARSLRGQILS